jgi:hypothetical protein
LCLATTGKFFERDIVPTTLTKNINTLPKQFVDTLETLSAYCSHKFGCNGASEQSYRPVLRCLLAPPYSLGENIERVTS